MTPAEKQKLKSNKKTQLNLFPRVSGPPPSDRARCAPKSAPTISAGGPVLKPLLEWFDLSQVAKGGKITKRWTNNKKPDFAPGPGTVIIGFSAKNMQNPLKISF